MFGANHSKLKSNLKLAIQRLKLLEKKKTENARKNTKEIADFIQNNKIDRAKIKAEFIIRDDYMVEGMEIVEMYCDLLLARFGLVESMKELDLGLYECVASLIWVAPRLESECTELRIIANELERKYGKEFAQMCRSNKCEKVNERLMIKMSEQAPGDLLVEKYLVEIAKSHSVSYQPDPNLSIRDPDFFFPSNNEHKNDGSSNGNAGGFSQPPMASEPSPQVNQQASYIGFHQTPAVLRSKNENKTEPKDFREEFSFPNVPDGNPEVGNLSSDYDDLTSRFERLKKK